MTKEKINKANELLAEIQFLERQISNIDYSLKDNYKERESYLKWHGNSGDVVIPESLFKVVNKLILDEYTQMLNEIKNEFENL